MRIARFSVDDEPKYGVVETDDPEGLAGTVNVLDSDPLYRSAQFTGEKLQLADVRLLAPVIPRSKVVCVGRNYAAHAAELGNDVPEQPLIFLKPNTSVIGPRDGIVYPEQTGDLHFEGELAIVIGRICRDLPKERVNEVIFGYTIANDVTARDLQKSDGQWARAKGFDTFCPLGPWISTELDVSDLRVSTELNGEPKQDGRTSQFIFDIPEVLAYITSFTTLLPGDVVLTGTPAGVGPMLPGDEVSVSIEGIGTLTNKVIVRD
ncbi:2-keto-4-pentenoate hydratase/2-oxohepta-3-ene-1,7-dioic acid hydratase in catechol pathway [Kribbella pratensis]|uniref:2-keto-4-pentenoate hydratase/2-oxohepta-3-ene-1,7-dioic acid hydratase in catechol pathway n=1 Tax=Kribbella pratensis TaxID=2512112 RepID=A0ABY2F5A0_9ACTN|nr:fumarylacetoacetate hydrolase family protein [Kribbella pratensis]TDW81611.1 2-keto-4-pentenoate hydratase/2-oxohepta-3-ene-1,7-dioic acid hydratase in catechol pathway [Kribbella pratensis]